MLKKISKYIVVFFILSIHLVQIHAEQDTVDSLRLILKDARDSEKVNLLNEISRACWSVSLELSLEYAQEALSLAESLKDLKGIADALNRLGNAEYLGVNYQDAHEYYLRSLEIRRTIGDNEGIMGSLNNLYLVNDITGHKETAVNYIQEAYELSIEVGEESEIAHYSGILGSKQSELHEFEEAGVNLEKALEIYESLGNIEGTASITNRIGEMYQRMTIYDKAQEYYFRALDLYKECDNLQGIAGVKNNIGIIYYNLDNLDVALDYYNQSLEHYNQAGGINRGIASVQNNIGVIWAEKKDFEKALDYYTQALESYEKIEDIRGIATASHNTGMVQSDLMLYEDAMQSYMKSLELNKLAGSHFSIANNYNNIGELHFLKKEYDQALRFLDMGLEIAGTLHAREIICENYLFRSSIHRETGEYEKSLSSYELYDLFRDSIFTAETDENIAKLQLRHRRESQIAELDMLQNDFDIQQLNIDRQHNLLVYLGRLALLTVLFLLIVAGMFRYKKRLKIILVEKTGQLETANLELVNTENNLQRLNATKDKFFSIIAHDLKNPFNALLGFSETLHENYKELTREQVKTYIDIINKSAVNLYRLLENLLEWSRSQTGNISFNPEKFLLKDVAETGKNTILANARHKNITILTDIDPSLKAFADKNIISTVIRNLVNNAVKFTQENGEVVITAKEHADFIKVSVSDNGIGISRQDVKKLFNLDYNITTVGTNDEKGTGLGLMLCKEFIEKSGGRIWVESETGRGSKFMFTVPK